MMRSLAMPQTKPMGAMIRPVVQITQVLRDIPVALAMDTQQQGTPGVWKEWNQEEKTDAKRRTI